MVFLLNADILITMALIPFKDSMTFSLEVISPSMTSGFSPSIFLAFSKFRDKTLTFSPFSIRLRTMCCP